MDDLFNVFESVRTISSARQLLHSIQFNSHQLVKLDKCKWLMDPSITPYDDLVYSSSHRPVTIAELNQSLSFKLNSTIFASLSTKCIQELISYYSNQPSSHTYVDVFPLLDWSGRWINIQVPSCLIICHSSQAYSHHPIKIFLTYPHLYQVMSSRFGQIISHRGFQMN